MLFVNTFSYQPSPGSSSACSFAITNFKVYTSSQITKECYEIIFIKK